MVNERGDAMKLATGHYINYYTEDGKTDLFIIINEANDVNEQKISEAMALFENRITPISNKELKTSLESIFEYGVQILRRV